MGFVVAVAKFPVKLESALVAGGGLVIVSKESVRTRDAVQRIGLAEPVTDFPLQV